MLPDERDSIPIIVHECLRLDDSTVSTLNSRPSSVTAKIGLLDFILTFLRFCGWCIDHRGVFHRHVSFLRYSPHPQGQASYQRELEARSRQNCVTRVL